MKISRREWLRFCVGSVVSVSLDTSPGTSVTGAGIRVTGIDGHARFLTRPMLQALPLRCSTTPRGHGGNSEGSPVTWAGCTLTELVDRRSLQEVAWCSAIGSDGYAILYRAETVLAPGVVLAWVRNGSEIPIEFGAPFRLILPSLTPKRHPKAVAELGFYRGFPTHLRFSREAAP